MTPTRSTLATSTAGLVGQATFRKRLSKVLIYFLLLLLAVMFIAPVWFMLMTSLKPNTLAVRDMGSVMGFVPRTSAPDVPAPEGWTVFQNYRAIFDKLFVGRMYLNSFIICIGVVLGRIIVDSMAAYSLARLRWRGQHLVLIVIISLIIIPFEAIAMPLLLLVNRFGWLNSYQGQIIPFISSPLAIFLFYHFFLNFPTEIEEAARIDGASFFRVFTTIVVPTALPVFATVTILAFLEIWGSFLWPLMVTRNYEYRPVILGLFFFFDQRPLWGEIMAYATMVSVPVLIVFLIFQRWFIQSVVSSGIKG